MSKKTQNSKSFKNKAAPIDKPKPMVINIFQVSNSQTNSLIKNSVNERVVEMATADGWYASSYEGSGTPPTQNSILFLHNPPEEGVKTFLSGYQFTGIGPKVVDKLYASIGIGIVAHLLNGTFADVAKALVNEKTINNIIAGWEKAKDYAGVNILLNELGFKGSQKRFVREHFGASFITRLNQTPFETLGAIPRLNFQEMEKILSRVNIDVDPEQIILAAAHFRLSQTERSYGNTSAPTQALISAVSKITNRPEDLVSETLEANHERFHWFLKDKKHFVQTRASNERDQIIRENLERIKEEFQRAGSNKNFVRSELKTSNDIELSEEQLVAVNRSVNEPVSIITGGPGAGKTTMVLGLVSALEALEQTVKICAPTGRAAKRIEENPTLAKYKPSTIHRFLASTEQQKKKDFDVMIVDEASMIDVDLLVLLLEKIPDGASLVFIGDPDQLPPVGPGQVFRDIIDSGFVPVSRLTGNFRQAEFSDIIKAARGIITGKANGFESHLEESDFVFIETPPGDVATKVIASFFEDLPHKLPFCQQSEFQILSPMREHAAGIKNLNSVIQAKLSKGTKPAFEKKGRDFVKRFYTGDRVIMTQNNYELEIMNGDVGEFIGKTGTGYTIDFEGREVELKEAELDQIELAFAISIHKSQGSEYPGVIIPITTEHSFMLSRNLIYTAVTRGRQQVILIGQMDVMKQAIARVMKDRRYTGLKEILVT